MNLHEDRGAFGQYIEATADFLGITDAGIVEKDYFVTLFLKNIIKKRPDMIFKGGTSLSKCYKIINRFSEDIDMNVRTEAAKLTEGQRKRLKQDVISSIEELGFSLENLEKIRSRREFNRYVVNYKTSVTFGYLKPYLVVETDVFIKSFPTETMEAASLTCDFLLAQKLESEVKKYNLEPFIVQVQAKERTFIDKVFAIADYYLDGHTANHSRHIYDLYKLYPKIVFNCEFMMLVKEVRDARKPRTTCFSAQDGVDVQELLREIASEDVYKSDYNQITDALLFEELPYSEAVSVLEYIIKDGCFA
ncbi:MAG: nucleotidyl transferase AbiEii/AbiGii toxin family protein [Clostridiales bacterium]|nr:nucleotidyl transferase AbiEii/AbiGii toxin family protein [Clostridiales bacterium]